MLEATPDQIVITQERGLLVAYHVLLPHVKAVGSTSMEAYAHLREWFVNHYPDEFWGLPTRSWWWTFHHDPDTLYVANTVWEELRVEAIEHFIFENGEVPKQIISYTPTPVWYFPLDKLVPREPEPIQSQGDA